MKEEVRPYWEHAENALQSARNNIELDPSTAANRAYYAALAVSALLVNERGKALKRHTAVESAVFRDLVNTGRWSPELGAKSRDLGRLRTAADYVVTQSPTRDQARQAVEDAAVIVSAVKTEIQGP
jgi:uncharacterized protein (UPF0332 family)